MAFSILKRRKLEELMRHGVTILDPASTFIDPTCQIGKDTVIYPNSYIEGKTVIGEDCILYPGSRILTSRIGNTVTLFDHCLILESEIQDGSKVGPFAHLRPQSQIGKGARIGNFVEIKKSEIGESSKVPHLSYIGDSAIGKKVNIGAGSITCNYDGYEKHRTQVEDGVFVGSNTLFIAPVSVGEGAMIAAGSVITEDVPPRALAIARARQINKEGWAKNWHERKAKQKGNKPR
jgi:bifunctional UDP-N-acetylglucosamine pyrophosphorylase/glucosamine-1-phosphate N-acetyltransferase